MGRAGRRVADSLAVAVRILHSFPHKIGASRICTTAWWEVASVAER